MEDTKVIRNMRQMAWERAKGELNAMMHTFWNEHDQFIRLDEIVQNFIEEVEENGLQE